MPYVDTPPGYRYPWYVRLLLALQRRRYGRALEPARLWGRTPRVFVAFLLVLAALERRRSPLEPRLRALVMVRVSQINVCEFCVDFNAATALERGLDPQALLDLADFESSAAFSERERAALAYAEAITYSDRQTAPEHFARLRAHFDDDAIVELTALVAFQNMSSKFNAALGVPPQGLCRLPPG